MVFTVTLQRKGVTPMEVRLRSTVGGPRSSHGYAHLLFSILKIAAVSQSCPLGTFSSHLISSPPALSTERHYSSRLLDKVRMTAASPVLLPEATAGHRVCVFMSYDSHNIKLILLD